MTTSPASQNVAKSLGTAAVKEKLLAALRGGIKTVLIPKENEKDLNIPDDPKVEILGSEIADDEKTATVQVKNEDGKEDEIELKKVDDEWKITTTS